MKYLKNSLITIITIFIITKVYTQSIDTTIQIRHTPLTNITINKDKPNTLLGISFDTSIAYKYGVIRFLDNTERLISIIVHIPSKKRKSEVN